MNSQFNNNLQENISFFFEEKDNMTNTDDSFIYQIMEEIDQEEIEQKEEVEENPNKQSKYKLMYFMDKQFYGDDELYYNHECTVKDLLKICEYYGIDKNIKSSKCKKQDIVSTIIYFESLQENYEIVKKRNLMWAYLTELMNDTKMKKYVIWS